MQRFGGMTRAVEPGKSKHLAQSLRALDEQYPKQWKGKLVRYSSLVDTLDTSDLMKAAAPEREQEFFGKFFREIDKVNAQFCRAAKAVISAYRRRHSWWFAWFRSNKVKIAEDVDGVELCPEALAMHTQICLEYARLNTEVLRRIAEEHDELFGNEHGKIILDSMWKTHSGLATFLHSPLLSELEAVAGAFPGVGGGGSVDETEKPEAKEVNIEECAEDESLQCPICLDTLYKPVGLACGHKFCAPCVLKAVSPGSVVKSGYEHMALTSVSHRGKCPQCRQQGVFKRASMLTVLGRNLQAKFPKYWRERETEEKEDRRKSKEAIIRHLEARGLASPSIFLYV